MVVNLGDVGDFRLDPVGGRVGPARFDPVGAVGAIEAGDPFRAQDPGRAAQLRHVLADGPGIAAVGEHHPAAFHAEDVKVAVDEAGVGAGEVGEGLGSADRMDVREAAFGQGLGVLRCVGRFRLERGEAGGGGTGDMLRGSDRPVEDAPARCGRSGRRLRHAVFHERSEPGDFRPVTPILARKMIKKG